MEELLTQACTAFSIAFFGLGAFAMRWLHRMLKTQERRSADGMQAAQAEMNIAKSELEAAKADLLEQILEVKNQLEAREAANAAQEIRIKTMQESHRQQIIALNKEYNTKIDGLQSSIDELDGLKKKVADYADKIIGLQAQVDELERSNETLKKQIHELNLDLVMQKAKNHTLESIIDRTTKIFSESISLQLQQPEVNEDGKSIEPAIKGYSEQTGGGG